MESCLASFAPAPDVRCCGILLQSNLAFKSFCECLPFVAVICYDARDRHGHKIFDVKIRCSQHFDPGSLQGRDGVIVPLDYYKILGVTRMSSPDAVIRGYQAAIDNPIDAGNFPR